MLRAALVLGLVCPGLVSCSTIQKDIAFPEDMTGMNIVGVSTGWSFAEADVTLENGMGPLANPLLGGSDVGSSTTDLTPVFGIGLKYLRYLTNNWLVGILYEHRIFNPEPTSPLSAEVDLDDFGTNHFILEGRYQWNPVDAARRFRPFASVQLGFIPEIKADGVVRYGAVPPLGLPPTTEDISLEGSSFFTLAFLVGGSYLIRENLTFDFSAFYEFALNPSEDQLVLNPYPNSPPLDSPTTYDGELLESGLFLTVGLSWAF